MKKLVCSLFFMFITTYGLNAKANCSLQIQVDDIIAPGISDYVERSISMAQDKKCENILLLLNTPGGDLQSTRKIVTHIINSPVPFLCLIYPSGGHAGSAGAIIMQACHVSGAMKATNIGAATPIAATGGEMPKDLRNKLLNDTTSWLEGLTKMRGRNLEFSKQIITEAKAVSATEAQKLNAIDILAVSKDDFLAQSVGREVELTKGLKQEIEIFELINFDPDLRVKTLQLMGDPQFSYMIFMGSLGLLYFELTHPGMIVPGVVGALGLVVSLIAFEKLNVEWGGLALMLLGVIFLVAELFVPSFGALGIGGIISFIVGSTLLFDPAKGLVLPLSTILGTASVIGSFMMLLAYLAYKSFGVKKWGGYEGFVGATADVIFVSNSVPEVMFKGERWKCESEEELKVGDKVMIMSHTGLKLKVKKV